MFAVYTHSDPDGNPLRKSILGLFVLLIASTALAQDSTNRVIAEALKASPLEINLGHLTDRIGGRVPGTPAMNLAVQWGVDAFKAAGADRFTPRISASSLPGPRGPLRCS